MENLKITKDGQLLMDVWSQSKKEWRRDVNATEKPEYCFNHVCKLDEGVTLRSICQLLENLDRFELLSPMLTNSPEWLREVVFECLESPVKDPEGNSLVINWRCTVDKAFEGDGTELWMSVDFHSLHADEDEKYALSFTSARDIADYPITLDNKLNVMDDRHETFEKQKELRDRLPEEEQDSIPYWIELLATKKDFTLQEILYGIFWELTFHGSPKERDEAKEEIMGRIKGIESGETKTVPWEEVKERLKNELDS